MDDHFEQNTKATSNRKRPHNKDKEVSKMTVSALKRTRLEAKTSNPDRIFGDNILAPNQYNAKMEARLAPLQGLLASLPNPLDKETKKFASALLSKAIEVLHCKRKVDYHEKQTAYLPKPIRFKFQLETKPEYEDNQDFIEERASAKIILNECIQSQRKSMVKVMTWELEGAIKKLHKEFVEGLEKLLIIWINFYKFADPDNMPPFTNEEGTEALLQLFFEQSDDSLFSYLKTTREIFKTILENRASRSNYNSTISRTTEEINATDKFLFDTSSKVFPQVRKISIELLNDYTRQLNEKEAETRTEALIANRDTTSITTATASALENEEKLSPQNMITFVDERISISKENVKGNKNKKKNKNKSKNNNKTSNTNTDTVLTSTVQVANGSDYPIEQNTSAYTPPKTDANDMQVKAKGTRKDHSDHTQTSGQTIHHQQQQTLPIDPLILTLQKEILDLKKAHQAQAKKSHHYGYENWSETTPNHYHPTSNHSTFSQTDALASIYENLSHLETQPPSNPYTHSWSHHRYPQEHGGPWRGRGRGRGRGRMPPRGRGRGSWRGRGRGVGGREE